VVAVAINIPLMAVLVGPMGIEGLALALSISATLEVLGLLVSLHRRIESIEGSAIAAATVRAAAGAGVAALVMLGGLRAVEAAAPALLGDTLGRVAVLFILVAAGGLAFLVVAFAARSPELELVRHALWHRRRGAG
jgi:peptidoglycan biosynthesis protein MviN/MurJ (putative lipid II flippase)